MAVKKEPGSAIIAKLRLADNGIDYFDTSPSNSRSALVDFLQLCTTSANYLLQPTLTQCSVVAHLVKRLVGRGFESWPATAAL